MNFSNLSRAIHSRILVLLCSCLSTWFIFSPTLADQPPQYLLKLATLAPEGSSWVKTVRSIDQEIRQKTAGAVGFKLYPGGVQGDDTVLLRKMRIGQLQAAGFTGQGIAMICPDVLALEMPFLFNDYEEVDYIFAQMDDYYHRNMEQNGFVLLGWSDIGFVHILSKQPIRSVADIRQRKVWRLEDEPITRVLFHKAGVTSVPLTIPDVLLGLQTNMIDVVYAPPVAAILMQWFTRVEYLTSLPINYTLGALVVDKGVFDKIPPEYQQLLHQVCSTHMRQLTLQTRRENEEAVQVMLANGLEMVNPQPEEVRSFEQLVGDSIPELVGKSFSQEAYDLLQGHLKTFRRNRE